MERLFIVVVVMLLYCTGKAQKLKNEFEYKVTYDLSYKLDSTDLGSEKSEYMILFLGSDVSVYSSRAKTMSRSIVTNGFSGHTSKSALTKFHSIIVKDSKKEKIYYTLQVPGIPEDHFYYIQDLDLMQWEIGSETKQIEGYHTQKATTNFAGRTYVAWFTPEIPISEGPYKFNGLPGLILEISDTENHYTFNFKGLEKLSKKLPFGLDLNKLVATDKEDLEELWHRYRLDPFTYNNNPNVTMDPQTHKKYKEAFAQMLEEENNPIELN